MEQMTTMTLRHPPIVSRDQWVAERKKLLADERELTRHYDRVNAGRRRLPMVKIRKGLCLPRSEWCRCYAKQPRYDARRGFSRSAVQARGLQSAKGVGTSRGFRRLAATSITIFT
jgi:hypothetical protein